MESVEMAFPESVEEACDLLAENPDARPIAGGTALGVVIKEGLYKPERLINLRSLEADMSGVEENDDAIHVGALTTMREFELADPIREYVPTVSECLAQIAGVRVRNSATIGGHLAHADAHLDLPPTLAGLDTVVVVTDGNTDREVPVDEFIRGYYEVDLREGELIREIVVPKPPAGTRGVYLKHRYYSEVDWPCVGVAAYALTDGGTFSDVRVLLNSVGRTSILELDGIEDVVDVELSDDAVSAVADLAMEQATPSSDIRGSAAYKERMAGEFTRRALVAIRDGGVDA